MEAKLKHLEFTQGVINRLAGNSFSLKTWAVTIVSAIVLLATKEGFPSVVLVALLPIMLFWFLDAYFLRQERIYREIYRIAAARSEPELSFSLDPRDYTVEVKGYIATMSSITLRWFYGGLIVTVIVIAVVLHFSK
jgi:hypothetical protein